MKNRMIALAIVAFALSACGRFSNEEKSTSEKEEKKQGRIVCLAKQYNEIIYALGAEDNLVAVDLSSTYPPEIQDLPTVGYHRALSAEGILSMKPDLIIHDNNIGPEHVVKQVEQMKIPMKVFGDYDGDIEGTQKLMLEMGEYFDRKEKAKELSQKLEEDMAKALEAGKTFTDTPTVVLIHYGRASNIYLTVTKSSTAAKMVEWAGGEMAIDGEGRMRRLTSPELIAKANPDVILLTDFGYDRLGSLEKIKNLPGVAGTNAAESNRIFRVEEHDLIYIGPRTGENVLKLQELIHKVGV